MSEPTITSVLRFSNAPVDYALADWWPRHLVRALPRANVARWPNGLRAAVSVALLERHRLQPALDPSLRHGARRAVLLCPESFERLLVCVGIAAHPRALARTLDPATHRALSMWIERDALRSLLTIGDHCTAQPASRPVTLPDPLSSSSSALETSLIESGARVVAAASSEWGEGVQGRVMLRLPFRSVRTTSDRARDGSVSVTTPDALIERCLAVLGGLRWL